MTSPYPYNPLDKRNLGASVADAILRQTPVGLPPLEQFDGAGLYAIYYVGSYPAYHRVAEANRQSQYKWPLYVGKAIPAGGRKRVLDPESEKVGAVLWRRLKEHAESIQAASNLDIRDFSCRFLVVDDIWIPLGESLLIQQFSPIWNLFIDGFGNHDPGAGRRQQKKSPWDVLHPGRNWAEKLADNPRAVDTILMDLTTRLSNLRRQ